MRYDRCWLPSEDWAGIGRFEVLGESLMMRTIRDECIKGVREEGVQVIFSQFKDLPKEKQEIFKSHQWGAEGYTIQEIEESLYVVGQEDKGVLYGMFHLFRLIEQKVDLTGVCLIEKPASSIRMINHWDNMNEFNEMGNVERGYAGQSIFFENSQVVQDKSRIKDYARLLASIGINGVSINNVNVHQLESQLITKKYLPEVRKVAAILQKYGIKLFLSVNFASPIELGGLSNADPLNDEVDQWWRSKIAEIYAEIPYFGGFIIKADSEGRPGPFTYGRTHADGANMIGKHLQPYHGIVFWRCFVYNCFQDWRNRKIDRACAAYEHFMPLDGKFLDNVILQIKNGPIDFQVREPISPLLGAMKKTNQVLELQITQEYTGHDKDVCFLVSQWKHYLEFDTYAKGENSTLDKVVSGLLYDRNHGGIVAVSNIGNDWNWTGHKLAQANLYGYGRLIWNPQLETKAIVTEWIHLTFGQNKKIVENIKEILLNSWTTYEKYTAPLGVGFMVEPGLHYGPNVDGYEYSRWGTYHFADRNGVGVNRTLATGSGYTKQYFSPHDKCYEEVATCPDELLLFFHHVPYTHKLQSGKTVIQHIYDTHFEGVEEVKQFITLWDELEGIIDETTFHHVQMRLQEQLENAVEWRDQINTYFYRKSGIRDQYGRTIYE